MIWSTNEWIDLIIIALAIIAGITNSIYFQIKLIKGYIKQILWKKYTIYFLNIFAFLITAVLIFYFFFSFLSIHNSWFFAYIIKNIIIIVLIIAIISEWIIMSPKEFWQKIFLQKNKINKN